MTRQIDVGIYSDEPIELGARIGDFLPSPTELAQAEETVKITIGLSQRSIDFFKRQAAEHHIPYQRLIRRLLDEYVVRHGG
jgi:predicted DNA binding CopG/RHH family protein